MGWIGARPGTALSPAEALRVLIPDRLRQGGIFNLRFVENIMSAWPRHRLRWHCFMLWQRIGVDLWRELFLDGGVTEVSSWGA